ncbi:MAG: helix-turn-helix domain-containing protein [Alphaproteobacteria bacterium]|nr:helix-turn-helix domain-containing protein [Alphaproteobacteria bacterium]
MKPESSRRPANDEIVIRGRAQMRAFASPLRAAILEALTRRAPLSMAEIAAAVGRPRPTLYHHLTIMLRAGLVLDAGARGKGRKREQLYKAAASIVRTDPNATSKQEREDLASLTETHTRYVLRRHVRAMKAGTAVREGPNRNATVRHLMLDLKPKDLRALNKDIEALAEKWAAKPKAGAHVISLLILMGPKSD